MSIYNIVIWWRRSRAEFGLVSDIFSLRAQSHALLWREGTICVFCFNSLSISLTIYLLVMSTNNLCKQFGPRSGPTKCRAWSGSKLFDTLTAFLKEFLQKVDFEKISRRHKFMQNYPACKELTRVFLFFRMSLFRGESMPGYDDLYPAWVVVWRPFWLSWWSGRSQLWYA